MNINPIKNTIIILWNKISLMLVILIIISFSTDLRIGLNLKLGAQPDFQCFELATLLLCIFLLMGFPYIILQYRIRIAREDVFLASFIIYVFLMAIFAKDTLHAFSRAKDFMISAFLYGYLRYGPLNQKQLNQILYLMAGLGCFWSIIGICQWIGLDKNYGGELYSLFLAKQALYKTEVDFSTADVIKTTFSHGLYLYPQNFIYYLLFPFALMVSYSYKNIKFSWFAGIIFLAMLGTLSKTFELLLLLFTTFYTLNKILRNRWLAFVSVTCLAFIVFIYVEIFIKKYFIHQALGTFIWRTDIWNDTFNMIVNSPIVLVTGHGTELLREVYSRDHYPNPHNLLLYLFIEYGIIGFILFCTFFTFLMVKLNRCYLKTKEYYNRQYILLYYALVFYLFMGVVDDIIVQTQLDGMLFLVIGILSKIHDINTLERKMINTI